MPKSKSKVTFLRGYRFGATEQDPILDQVDTWMDDQNYTVAEVHERSGVSKGTLYNWRKGVTRFPQFRTVSAVMAAVGYKLAATPMKPAEKKLLDRKNASIPACAPKVLFSSGLEYTGKIKPSKIVEDRPSA